MKEVWKDIAGYSGFYQVSNLGRVKSLSRVVPICNRVTPDKLLSPNKIKSGYLRVSLSKDGITERFLVHRLVISAFLHDSNLMVNHKDFNKINNNIKNLEYVTRRENIVHYRKSINRDLPLGVRALRHKYQARLSIDNKVIYLGVYDTPGKAALAYKKAVVKFTQP